MTKIKNIIIQKPLSHSELDVGFIQQDPKIPGPSLWGSFSRFVAKDSSEVNENDCILERDLVHSRLYGHVLNKYPNLHPGIKGSLWSEGSKMAQALDDFASSLEPSPTEAEFLEKCAQKLHRASQINEIAEKEESEALFGTWNNNLNQLEIYNQIAKLKPEESFIINGAWKNHAIIYEIIRKEDHFIFTIINTGKDEPEWPSRLAPGETIDSTQGRYRHKGYILANISLELLMQILPIPNTEQKDCNTTLATIDHICLQKLHGEIHLGRLHYPQRRGNCGQKCLTSWLLNECIEKFGPIEGRYLYERFRFYYSKKLCAEIDSIDREASRHKLMTVYQANSGRELDGAIITRKKACQEVISKREAKLDLLERLIQDPIFREIYIQLIRKGWNLQSVQNIEELRNLIKKIEKQGRNPMELIAIVTKWKGSKTWKKFKEGVPGLLNLIKLGKITEEKLDQCSCTYSLVLSTISLS